MNVSFGADGGIAIYSGNVISVLAGSAKVDDKPKGSKRRNQKVTNHTYFFDLCRFTSDPFWKDFLNNCGKGFFPKKYTYSDGTLMYKNGTTFKQIKLMDVPSTEAFLAMKEFLFNSSSLESTLDTQLRNSQINNGEIEEISWSRIKMSPHKMNPIIGAYIAQIKDKYQLNNYDFEVLFQSLKTMIMANIFHKSAFIYSKGKLEDIKGLTFDEENRCFVVTKFMIPKEVSYGQYLSDTFTETRTNMSEHSVTGSHISKFDLESAWEHYLNKKSK